MHQLHIYTLKQPNYPKLISTALDYTFNIKLQSFLVCIQLEIQLSLTATARIYQSRVVHNCQKLKEIMFCVSEVWTWLTKESKVS